VFVFLSPAAFSNTATLLQLVQNQKQIPLLSY
jgi:hypothetical protein